MKTILICLLVFAQSLHAELPQSLVKAILDRDAVKVEGILCSNSTIDLNDNTESILNYAIDSTEGILELLLENGLDPNANDKGKPIFLK